MMNRRGVALALLLGLGLVLTPGCVGTTGGDVIDFPVAASGPADVETTKTAGFTTDRGWHVVLTRAALHVGALYLNQLQPVSGSQVTGCVLPGTYVAQLTTGMDIDLLSPVLQRFSTLGHGTTLEALTGQVWLAGGAADHDIDQVSDTTPILVIEGTADRAGDVRPFSGQVTIASNRVAQGGAVAGSSTICKQRNVSPIPTRLTLQHTGGLLLRIDPRQLFVNVDFGQLAKVSSGYAFSDDPSVIDPSSPLFYSQPSANLYQNLHAGGVPGIPSLYAFTWTSEL
jgi:hypothetical protein